MEFDRANGNIVNSAKDVPTGTHQSWPVYRFGSYVRSGHIEDPVPAPVPTTIFRQTGTGEFRLSGDLQLSTGQVRLVCQPGYVMYDPHNAISTMFSLDAVQISFKQASQTADVTIFLQKLVGTKTEYFEYRGSVGLQPLGTFPWNRKLFGTVRFLFGPGQLSIDGQFTCSESS